MSAALLEVLTEAQRLGFLGPGTVGMHVEHAHGFLIGLDAVRSLEVVVDLGSGGGVPALVVALERSEVRVVLVERMRKRADWLLRATTRLSLSDRVTVAAMDSQRYAVAARENADAVTARSFGSPAVLVECAAPLLRLGGRLIASDVHERDAFGRWPVDGLAALGLAPCSRWEHRGWPFVAIESIAPCPRSFPRGQPAMERKPLF